MGGKLRCRAIRESNCNSSGRIWNAKVLLFRAFATAPGKAAKLCLGFGRNH